MLIDQYFFRTILGGTIKLERHKKLDTDARSAPACLVRTIPRSAKKRVAYGAEKTVALDVHPLSFRNGCKGIAHFIEHCSNYQIVPGREKVSLASCFPRRAVVSNIVCGMAHSNRQDFLKEMREGCWEHGIRLTEFT